VNEPTALTEFCTIADRGFLAQALALHNSLAAVSSPFRLQILAMDDDTTSAVDRLGKPTLVALPLADLEAEHPELRAVRGERTLTEYCWTAKPLLISNMLGRTAKGALVTYVDGDLAFWSGLGPLAGDLGGGSVLLVPHRYSSGWRHVEVDRGVYNAGSIAFRNDAQAAEALAWWNDRCLEWCFDRVEPGRFADQKYLDELHARFAGIRVAERPEAGLAPWNVEAAQLTRSGTHVLVDGRPLIFFHHHGLQLLRGVRLLRKLGFMKESYRLTTGPEELVWRTWFSLTREQLELIWEPYLERVSAAAAELRAVGVDVRDGFRRVGLRAAAHGALTEPAPVARPAASLLRALIAGARRASP
jgi:hypothetical protein